MQNMNPSLDPTWFGNRKSWSTSHYLADLLHYVLNEVEVGETRQHPHDTLQQGL